MKNQNLELSLPEINSFEDYEKFKQENFKTLENLANKIISQYQLPEKELSLFSEGTNVVFAYGTDKVIKIFPPLHKTQFDNEILVLKHLTGKLTIKTPTVYFSGELAGWSYILMEQLEGTLLETLWETMAYQNKIAIMRQLGALIREVHTLPIQGLEIIDCHWQQFLDKQITNCVTHHRSRNLSESLLQQIPSYLEPIKDSLFQIEKTVLLTGEYTPMNMLVKQISGVWQIDGLFDFGDCMLGRAEYDLLGPGAFLIQGDKQLLKEFLSTYGYTPETMTSNLSHKLTALMLLHQYSNLNIQVRIENWKNKVNSLKDLENLVWGF